MSPAEEAREAFITLTQLWIAADQRLMKAQALLAECLIGAPHGDKPPQRCRCRWCKARRFLAEATD